VCAKDDFCCAMEWDGQCVGEATQLCGCCGGGAGGSPQGGGGSGAGAQGGSTSAGGGPGTGGSGGSTSGDSEQLCVDTINMYRAMLSLPPYARWSDAEQCTSDEAKSDSETGKAHGAFGMCSEFGQNECPGWPGPESSLLSGCLAQMWAEGPGADFQAHGHYLNMSSTKFTKVACGFYTTPSGKIWAIQNFK
jgi:hypothetical protein